MNTRAVPIGAAFDIRNGATPSSGEPQYWDGEIPWVTPADLGKVQNQRIAHGDRSITQKGYESCGTQLVPKGSVVISTRAPVGHLAIAEKALCFNQGCRGLIPRSIVHSPFSYWALLTAKPELEAAAQGSTFVELGRDRLRGVKIALPDLDTQRAIADFLDRETDRIDQLIEKKQRLVELLEEKQRTETKQLLTKGLNNHLLIESDDTWLGKVPEKWRLTTLQRLLTVHSGDFLTADAFRENGYPVFGGNGFRGYYSDYNTPAGTILIGRYGALCGNVHVVSEPVWATEHAFRVRKRFPYYTLFIARFVEALELRFLATRSAQPGLNSRMVREHRIALPPIEEQETISKRIEAIRSKAELAIAKITTSIDRLREYRSALITAAVTGQIDVNEWSRRGRADARLDAIAEEMESSLKS